MLPLWRWTVTHSIERKSRKEKGPKTGLVRYVPIHPELARVLARWRAEGWARHMGRAPTAEDLVVPSTTGTPLDATSALRRFYEDQRLLGMRLRHMHCTRRTFVSICRDDPGCRSDILRWISHGPTRKEIVDVYSSLSWSTLCREVHHFQVDLTPRGKLLQMPRAAGDDRGVTNGVTAPTNISQTRDDSSENAVPGTGLEPVCPSGRRILNPVRIPIPPPWQRERDDASLTPSRGRRASYEKCNQCLTARKCDGR